MQHTTPKNRFLLAGMLLLIVVAASAWQLAEKKRIAKDPAGQHTDADGDTTKSRKRNTDRDEYRMKEVDQAMRELDLGMRQLNLEMKNLDSAKIQQQVSDALASIDFNKISKEVARSLRQVDWANIQQEVNKALREAQQEVQQVKMEQVKQQLQLVQQKLNSDSFRLQFSAPNIQVMVEKELKQAQLSMEKAKLELRQAKTTLQAHHVLLTALEADGLVDREKGCRVELKNGELYINGALQSKAITDKYSQYYPNKDHFILQLDGGSTRSF